MRHKCARRKQSKTTLQIRPDERSKNGPYHRVFVLILTTSLTARAFCPFNNGEKKKKKHETRGEERRRTVFVFAFVRFVSLFRGTFAPRFRGTLAKKFCTAGTRARFCFSRRLACARFLSLSLCVFVCWNADPPHFSFQNAENRASENRAGERCDSDAQ